MKSRNPVYRQSLPSGARVWSHTELDATFESVMQGERDFIPQTPEESRLLQLNGVLDKVPRVHYALAREMLNIGSEGLRKLCAEGKLERVVNVSGQPKITSASIRNWLGTKKAKNVFKPRKSPQLDIESGE